MTFWKLDMTFMKLGRGRAAEEGQGIASNIFGLITGVRQSPKIPNIITY